MACTHISVTPVDLVFSWGISSFLRGLLDIKFSSEPKSLLFSEASSNESKHVLCGPESWGAFTPSPTHAQHLAAYVCFSAKPSSLPFRCGQEMGWGGYLALGLPWPPEQLGVELGRAIQSARTLQSDFNGETSGMLGVNCLKAQLRTGEKSRSHPPVSGPSFLCREPRSLRFALRSLGDRTGSRLPRSASWRGQGGRPRETGLQSALRSQGQNLILLT